MFLQTIDGDFRPIDMSLNTDVVAELPAGAYHVFSSIYGLTLRPFSCAHERLIRIEQPALSALTDQVRDYLLLLTRGRFTTSVLVHGPSGTGKQSLVRLTFDELIAHDVVIIVNCPPLLLHDAVIPLLRRRSPLPPPGDRL